MFRGQILLYGASGRPRTAKRSIHWANSSVVIRASIGLIRLVVFGDSFEMRDEAINLLANWASDYPNEVMTGVGSVMLDPSTGVYFFISKFPIFTALPLKVVIGWLETVGAKGARKIARHLPRPYLNADGEPMVPELTAWVLAHFESDDRTFVEFCAGVHSNQMYMGNIAGTHEAEARDARKFFNHQLRRIREWAQIEYSSASQNAQRHREWEDEMNR